MSTCNPGRLAKVRRHMSAAESASPTEIRSLRDSLDETAACTPCLLHGLPGALTTTLQPNLLATLSRRRVCAGPAPDSYVARVLTQAHGSPPGGVISHGQGTDRSGA